MSLNDQSIKAQGAGVYPGLANPTSSNMPDDPKANNFVNDPTSEETGAGAPANFAGHLNAKKELDTVAGVIERRPGIIDSTNIDPLNENSNKDDGWANATGAPGAGATSDQGAFGMAQSAISSATGMVAGAAKAAYGASTGDDQMAKDGKEAVFGSDS